jgi:prepilin-type N-terminal cleavage/methylation domain-containing protein
VRSDRRQGFTLLEALVVLAVTSVLICGASSQIGHLAPKYRLRRAAWEIQTRMNYARHRAIRDGRAVRVRFQPAGYTIEKYDEVLELWQPDAAGAIEGVAIQANNTPTFYPAGTVSNLATILLSNVSGQCKITLAITGRIKVTGP